MSVFINIFENPMAKRVLIILSFFIITHPVLVDFDRTRQLHVLFSFLAEKKSRYFCKKFVMVYNSPLVQTTLIKPRQSPHPALQSRSSLSVYFHLDPRLSYCFHHHHRLSPFF
jgi:hypothetical protein